MFTRVVVFVLFLLFYVHAQTCFGISNSSSVCSGHGTCVSNDTCVCYDAYFGNNCSLLDCGWSNSNSFGAPTPTVSLLVQNYMNVVFRVSFAKKHSVSHHAHFFDSSCSNSSSFVLVSQTNCTNTYEWTRSLQDLINDGNTTKVFGNGDVFDVKGTLFTSYSEENKCTTFQIPFTVRAYLQGTAFAGFGSSKQSIGALSQKRIYVNSASGLLHITAGLEMVVSGELSNFVFVLASNNIPMNISATVLNSPCGADNQAKCQYLLEFYSQGAANDFSGFYSFAANLTTPSQNLIIDISFHLQYLSPIPPTTANISLTTILTTYSPEFAFETSSFTGIDRIWVLDSIQQTISIPTVKLAIQNAWICCMIDRLPLPDTGCAIPNSNMSIHAQLIANEVATVQQWNSKLEPIPFVDTKTGFSFSALALNDQDRFCFLQANAFLKPKTRKFNRLAYDTLTAYSPFNVASKRMAAPKISTEKNESSEYHISKYHLSWTGFLLTLFYMLC